MHGDGDGTVTPDRRCRERPDRRSTPLPPGGPSATHTTLLDGDGPVSRAHATAN